MPVSCRYNGLRLNTTIDYSSYSLFYVQYSNSLYFAITNEIHYMSINVLIFLQLHYTIVNSFEFEMKVKTP